jgi:CSLREA domain-containing protein
MRRHRWQEPAAAVAALCVAFHAHAAAITVNSDGDAAADDGACTLREAIAASQENTASGASSGECAAGDPLPLVDTIAFAIPGGGVHTIRPASLLPAITEAVVIDGYTQPGSHPNALAVGDDAALLIEIDGSGFSGPLIDLRAGSDGSTVRGLVIDRVQGQSVKIASSGNAIEGNFLATDPSGTAFLGAYNIVVEVNNADNRIGGTTPAARNVIAATTTALFVSREGSVIQGNYIGVDAAGTHALQSPQGNDGIQLCCSASNTLIGGTQAGAGNVILGTNVGIDVRTKSANVTIQGNYIGTDASGSVGLGGFLGISGSFTSPNLVIGGSAPLAGNVISGNAVGIEFFSVADGLVIQGNKIGTDASGSLPVSNSSAGIEGFGTPDPVQIGGTGAGEGNTIAFNCGAGVELHGAAWTVLGNAIWSNRGAGIDTSLPAFGGPATPAITSLSIAAGSATVSGTLDADASTVYRIEFFGNVVCDASGNGEGRSFLGSTDVATDAAGHADFGPLDFPTPDGEPVVTATATDPDGLTSAFSVCAGVADRMFRDGFEGAVCGGGL